jgi:hypothetical protein
MDHAGKAIHPPPSFSGLPMSDFGFTWLYLPSPDAIGAVNMFHFQARSLFRATARAMGTPSTVSASFHPVFNPPSRGSVQAEVRPGHYASFVAMSKNR